MQHGLHNCLFCLIVRVAKYILLSVERINHEIAGETTL